MKIPVIKIAVRWSDLDANMHLANASYANFTSFTRTYFLSKFGITLEGFKKYQMGPIIFHENFSFFKEVLPNSEVFVSFEVKGLSQTGDLFEFIHNFYDNQGSHLAKSYILGSWIDFNTRKLAVIPQEWSNILKSIAPKNCELLNKEKLKTLPHQKQNIDFNQLVIN